MLQGVSGIAPITRFDISAFPCRFGGAVKDFELEKYLTPKEARRMDEFMHYGIAAGVDAMADSGLDLAKIDLDRAGVITGSGIGGLQTIEDEHNAFLAAKSPRKISPFFVPSTIINMISGHLSIRFGLRGPNLGVVTACTTSTHALGLGMRTIQYGDADIVLAGGAEMATTRHGPGRLRPGQGAVHAQRFAHGSQPPLGQGPRRLRAQRWRRRHGARGTRAREAPRRAHLRRARRVSA